MGNSFKISILKNRSDFLYILKNGRRVRPSDWLLINFFYRRESGEEILMRCGWTVPRQVGPAVIRNRLKRWSRVYFRNRLKAGEALPADINLVFRKADKDFYKKLDYGRFSEVLDIGFRKIERDLRFLEKQRSKSS